MRAARPAAGPPACRRPGTRRPERAPPPGLDTVDLGHGRMRHRRHGPGFRLQPHEADEVSLRQGLDRHVALQTQIARQVDSSHAPGPQSPRQAELAGEKLRDLRGDVGRPRSRIGRRDTPRQAAPPPTGSCATRTGTYGKAPMWTARSTAAGSCATGTDARLPTPTSTASGSDGHPRRAFPRRRFFLVGQGPGRIFLL